MDEVTRIYWSSFEAVSGVVVFAWEGRVKIKARTVMATTLMTILSGIDIDWIMNNGNERLSRIKNAARIFAGIRITPSRCQSIMGFERVGCVISHW